MHKPIIVASLLLMLLQGCAATTPATLRDAPKQGPSPNQVRAQSEEYLNVPVRWGGTITRVENLPQRTRIEVVARRLHDNGEPRDEDRSEGRFIAEFDNFLDPSIYSTGRTITVFGRISGLEELALGQMRYHYPVLQAISHHLWPEPDPVYPHEHYDPYWYDPYFYDPWYPFRYPYPYYYPRVRPWPRGR